jgi:hypothetical protein
LCLNIGKAVDRLNAYCRLRTRLSTAYIFGPFYYIIPAPPLFPPAATPPGTEHFIITTGCHCLPRRQQHREKQKEQTETEENRAEGKNAEKKKKKG